MSERTLADSCQNLKSHNAEKILISRKRIVSLFILSLSSLATATNNKKPPTAILDLLCVLRLAHSHSHHSLLSPKKPHTQYTKNNDVTHSHI